MRCGYYIIMPLSRIKSHHHLHYLPTMMTLFALTLSFLLHISTVSAAPPPQPPTTGNIFLNCGSPDKSSYFDPRVWLGDTFSNYLPSNYKTISESSMASKQHSSITQPLLYKTARIIHSEFTYSFSQLPEGDKFLRLYFYSSTYKYNNNQINTDTSFFSLTANNYILLTNFSTFLNTQPLIPSSPTLVKEYIINLNGDNHLNLTFLPSNNSLAFVNAIEIVSIPKGLYHRGRTVQLVTKSNMQQFISLEDDRALETMYRINVGGSFVSAGSDTGMFREWYQEDAFLLAQSYTHDNKNVEIEYTLTPVYTAPKAVYNTARYMVDNYSLQYNMTWLFPVDSGFYYLLRLHFCEIFEHDIKEIDDRIFKIYINNITAEDEADVILWGGGRPNVAVFRDYVIYVNGDGDGIKQDLRLAMHPNVGAGSTFASALLNGLEIFRLSMSHIGLAAPNPQLVIITNNPSSSKSSNNNKKSKVWLIIAVTAAIFGGGGALMVGFLILRWRMKLKDSKKDSGYKKNSVSVGSSSLPAELCRHFPLEEIRKATSNFDDNLVIGVGGFGSVYKGIIEDNINGPTAVAIKRLDKSSKQGLHEFLTEIEMLSKLRHLHLVSLIGYCDENGEMILVYDYMSRGTLRDHLNKTKKSHLSWKRRLRICIGAARGLDYLHTGANNSVIHRDVKSTNILLDDKWVAKVSDFGLSKAGPVGTEAYISTAVKGSFGYLDPEYFKRQQLTEKSDVYSFGVVLFEVLCSRPAIVQNASKEEVSLASWVRFCKGKGTVDQIVDPKVKVEISPECLNKYIEIGLKCLKLGGTDRPAMSDVVWNLEFALQLQEAADEQNASMEENEVKQGSPSAIIPLLPHSFEADSEEDDGIFSRSMRGSSSCSKSKDSEGFSTNSDRSKSQR